MNLEELLRSLIGKEITSTDVTSINNAVTIVVKNKITNAEKPLNTRIKELEDDVTKLTTANTNFNEASIFASIGVTDQKQIANLKKFINDDEWETADEKAKLAILKKLPETSGGIITLPKIEGKKDSKPQFGNPKKEKTSEKPKEDKNEDDPLAGDGSVIVTDGMLT